MYTDRRLPPPADPSPPHAGPRLRTIPDFRRPAQFPAPSGPASSPPTSPPRRRAPPPRSRRPPWPTQFGGQLHSERKREPPRTSSPRAGYPERYREATRRFGNLAIRSSRLPGTLWVRQIAQLPGNLRLPLLWVEGAERYAVKLFQLLRHHGLVEFAAPGGAGSGRAARMTCGGSARPYGIGSLTRQAPEALSGPRRRHKLLDACSYKKSVDSTGLIR